MASPREGLGAQAERLGARADATGMFGRPRLVGMVLATYAAIGALAAALSLAFGRNPIDCGGWLGMRGAAGLSSSLGLGICLGAGTIAATRTIVQRAEWARALHLALRPAVHGVDGGTLLALAVASGIGEELLFRGLLVPTVGIALSSLAFGLVHQIRGRARWWWMAWATLMGLLFALIFAATGSLAGPIVAHAAINAANLRYLRDNDPSPPRRHLGGLLRRT